MLPSKLLVMDSQLSTRLLRTNSRKVPRRGEIDKITVLVRVNVHVVISLGVVRSIGGEKEADGKNLDHEGVSLKRFHSWLQSSIR